MLKGMVRRVGRAFTLVEILIVVVILGILASIVVPQFANATEEAAVGTTVHELEKLRRAMDVYLARWDNQVPVIDAGEGTWGPLVAANGEYLKAAPLNPYVGGENGRVIVLASSADTEYHRDYGWVVNDETGEIWAGGFDEDDEPLPQN